MIIIDSKLIASHFCGRTYTEYISMFDLEGTLIKKGYVLDCPAGASSFAAEAHQLDFNVTACDILYNLTVDELLEKGKQDIHLGELRLRVDAKANCLI